MSASFVTKSDFLVAYGRALAARYEWAKDRDKLARAVVACKDTLNGASKWDHKGACVLIAWRNIGMPGTPSLNSLRSLP